MWIRIGGNGKIWTVRGLDNQVLREWRADAGVHAFKDYVWTGRDLLAEVQRTPNGGSWTETALHAGTDHLSSVRKLTDATGHVASNHIYYPFGKELTSSPDTERIKWAGCERDLWNTSSTADDLDYLHARHYNPQLGRFLQVDPLAGSTLEPQSLNRYSYALGNPIRLIDPTGMATPVCHYELIPAGYSCSPDGCKYFPPGWDQVCTQANDGTINGVPPRKLDDDGTRGPGGGFPKPPTPTPPEPPKPPVPPVWKKPDPFIQAVLNAMSLPPCGPVGPPLTLSIDAGEGLGGNFTMDLATGDATLSLGFGVLFGASLTADAAVPAGQSTTWTLSLSGGDFLGGHVDVGLDSFLFPKTTNLGGGIGMFGGATLTAPVVSGNAYDLFGLPSGARSSGCV